MIDISDNANINGEHNSVDKKEPTMVGMTAETKDLYREDYRSLWQEWSPDGTGIDSINSKLRSCVEKRRRATPGSRS